MDKVLNEISVVYDKLYSHCGTIAHILYTFHLETSPQMCASTLAISYSHQKLPLIEEILQLLTISSDNGSIKTNCPIESSDQNQNFKPLYTKI